MVQAKITNRVSFPGIFNNQSYLSYFMGPFTMQAT